MLRRTHIPLHLDEVVAGAQSQDARAAAAGRQLLRPARIRKAVAAVVPFAPPWVTCVRSLPLSLCNRDLNHTAKHVLRFLHSFLYRFSVDIVSSSALRSWSTCTCGLRVVERYSTRLRSARALLVLRSTGRCLIRLFSLHVVKRVSDDSRHVGLPINSTCTTLTGSSSKTTSPCFCFALEACLGVASLSASVSSDSLSHMSSKEGVGGRVGAGDAADFYDGAVSLAKSDIRGGAYLSLLRALSQAWSACVCHPSQL